MRPLIASLLVLCAEPCLARSVITFDAPGYPDTCGTAISSNGLIVGGADSGNIAVGDRARRAARPDERAFVYINGRFTYPAPKLPSGYLAFYGIDRRGTILGGDADPSWTYFTLDGAKTRQLGLAQGSGPAFVSINDDGALLGAAAFSGAPWPGVQAFVLAKSGVLTVLNDGSGDMVPLGFDHTGEWLVGFSDGTGNGKGWLYHAGVFTPIVKPGAAITTPKSVDSKGTVTGTYDVANGSNSFVSHGFIWKDGVFTTWDMKGASATAINAANESGQFTGCYQDTAGTHGFVTTP